MFSQYVLGLEGSQEIRKRAKKRSKIHPEILQENKKMHPVLDPEISRKECDLDLMLDLWQGPVNINHGSEHLQVS